MGRLQNCRIAAVAKVLRVNTKILIGQFARALKLVVGEFWEGEGIFSAKCLWDVCRFAELQQLHEFTRVIGGGITRVLRVVDEGVFEFTQNFVMRGYTQHEVSG